MIKLANFAVCVAASVSIISATGATIHDWHTWGIALCFGWIAGGLK